MKALLISIGTAGDVFPFIALGKALQNRGNLVQLASHGEYRDVAESAGLTFRELHGTKALRGSVELYHPVRAIERIAKDLLLPALQPVYDLVAGLERGQWTVISHFFCYGARLSQEVHGTSLVTAVVNPFAIRSADSMPVFPKLRWLCSAPLFLRRAFFSMTSRAWDKQLAQGLNAYRTTLGLPPVMDIFYEWALSPRRVIGLFPEWFAPKAADWPAAFVHGGFPHLDQANGQRLPADLNWSDRPRVVFAAGSSGLAAESFFDHAIEASRGSHWQSLLLTGFVNGRKRDLPANVQRRPFIPFSAVLPQSDLFVHHGGLGSASAAMRAGVPQLVIPFGHDQFDTADRVVRLGVGQTLQARQQSSAIADAVTRLLNDRSIHERAREIARRMQSNASSDFACRLIEGGEPATS